MGKMPGVVAVATLPRGPPVTLMWLYWAMVDHDAVDLIGDIFERIGDSLEILEDLARNGELERIGAGILECSAQPERMPWPLRTSGLATIASPSLVAAASPNIRAADGP